MNDKLQSVPSSFTLLRFSRRDLWASLFAVVLCSPAQAQFVQQGSKLVGADTVGTSGQGYSVALSADGNTAIVGAPVDNILFEPTNDIREARGAALIYTRSGNSWGQQGPKLVGSSSTRTISQGFSVSISADGNTAMIGGSEYGEDAGGVWFFTRSAGAWAQQGPKISFPYIVPGAWNAKNIWISVALSGDGNTAVVGVRGYGTRVFARSGGIWTQLAILAGVDMAGSALDTLFGGSVAISADGNTIAASGQLDNNRTGATWIFTRSDGQWRQQGSKLVGSGAIGPAVQGFKVALSADGNFLLSSGISDDGGNGAVWCFARSAGIWSQQGKKIVPAEAPPLPWAFGAGVALSGDGNTAFVAGYSENNVGKITNYFRVFGRQSGAWIQRGSSFIGTGATDNALQCCGIAMSADGDTLIAGAAEDNPPGAFGFLRQGFGVGATWIFVRQSLRLGTPASAVAGIPISFGVLAVAPNNVTAAGYDGSVDFASSDPRAVLPQSAVLSNSAGNFSMTFRTTGPQTVSASFARSPLLAGTSNAILVRAANLQTSPSNLTMQYDQGTDSSLVTGTLMVSSDAPMPFSAAATNAWITVSPSSGIAPAVLIVRPSPTGLSAGSYNSAINLMLADGRTFGIPVSISVTPPVKVTFANGASFVEGPAAPNTLMAAFGNFRGCTSDAQVSFDGSPTTVFGSSPTQINFLVPPAIAGQHTSMVQITCGGLAHQAVGIEVALATPAIFTESQNGAGQPVTVNQDGSLKTPAAVGSIVTVYGTGFGQLVSGGPDGLARIALPVTAYIGDARAAVLYAGEAPGYTPGLQQINLLIPMDSPRGKSVPLRMVVGGFETQAGVTLAIQ